MHVAFERAGQRAGGWVVEVCGAEAAVPEIGRGVFVRDEEDGEGGGRGGGSGGEDAVRGGGRVVFLGVRGEGFGKGGAVGSARRGEGGCQSLCLSEGRESFLGSCVCLSVGVWCMGKGGMRGNGTYMSSAYSDSKAWVCTSDAFCPGCPPPHQLLSILSQKTPPLCLLDMDQRKRAHTELPTCAT